MNERERTMSGISKSSQVDEARLGQITTAPLPASRKVYEAGALHPFLRVPMREIAQNPTKGPRSVHEAPAEAPNPPIHVYDTSGPYTDPKPPVDVRRGLAPLRAEW